MKVLLIGAAGQLAHDLLGRLAAHRVVALDRGALDIRDSEQVARAIDAAGPDMVINAAAYNLVDQAESEPAEAFASNALAPRNLAIACQRRGIAMMQFSTDYVFGFDAERKVPWNVNDAPGPVSAYGMSKLAGEHATRAYCRKHFVVRTCGLYGIKGSRGKGGNFVETMLRLAQQGAPVRVVDDQCCTPSYTHDVAGAAVALMESEAYGLYHATNSGACTWHELACEIFRQANLDVDCRPITTSEFAAAARRPRYSVLSTDALDAVGVPRCPDWHDAVGRYLAARARRG